MIATVPKWGASNTKFARLARFIIGHFPHGEYRARFNLDGPRNCACGHPVESRSHILFDCPLWIRQPSLRRPRTLSRAFRAALIIDDDDESRYNGHPSLAQIHTFLEQNPMVATFEWADLLEQAEHDRQAGEGPHWTHALVLAHASLKVGLYRMYRERHGDSGQFFNKYDPSEVARKWLNRFRSIS
ncbi:hypothetical protein K474DRAFT_1713049 [Panus rudis PR-1116 ss-1]|nr:hypothetical protein K474DRAFT_1713049 [Panus rudis PR-1116 ss-1]